LGTSQQLAKITVRDVPLLSTVVILVDSVRDLGVIIDSQLCMDAHVAAPWHRRTWQMTVKSSPTSVRVDSVRLTL